MEYELVPRYDSRKSFYGKAIEIISDQGNHIELRSYNTIVAEVIRTNHKEIFIYKGSYSVTTTRHQKEFFKQYGLSDNEIKLLIKNGELIKEF